LINVIFVEIEFLADLFVQEIQPQLGRGIRPSFEAVDGDARKQFGQIVEVSFAGFAAIALPVALTLMDATFPDVIIFAPGASDPIRGSGVGGLTQSTLRR